MIEEDKIEMKVKMMDLKKVEKNLGKFSEQILEKIKLDIKEIDKKSAKTKWNEAFKKNEK